MPAYGNYDVAVTTPLISVTKFTLHAGTDAQRFSGNKLRAVCNRRKATVLGTQISQLD
jgi:hypothetical protein